MAKSYAKIYAVISSGTEIDRIVHFDTNIKPLIEAYWGTAGKEKRFPFSPWMFNKAFQESENNDVAIVIREISEKNFKVDLLSYNAGDRNNPIHDENHLFVLPFEVYNELITELGININSIEDYIIIPRIYKIDGNLHIYLHWSNLIALDSGNGIGPGGGRGGATI